MIHTASSLKNSLFFTLIILIISALQSLAGEITPERITVTVVRVKDGDTIVVQHDRDTHTIRLEGIDCPEHDQAPWGPLVTEFLREWIQGQRVQLEWDIQRVDRYQRELGYVFTHDRFINEELVRSGLCYTMTVPPNVRYRDRLRMALREAQEQRQGLWNPGAEPVTPPACHRHPSGSRLCQQERAE